MEVKHRLKLLFAAFSQVFFVTMNVYFISKGLIILMLLTSFMVTLIWAFNIKMLSIGNLTDRLFYASGAMIGTGFGYYVSHNIVLKI